MQTALLVLAPEDADREAWRKAFSPALAAGRLRLRPPGDADPFGLAFAPGPDGVVLVHPRATGGQDTFTGAVAGGECFTDQAFTARFRSPAGDNLLVFETPPAATRVQFQTGATYERIDVLSDRGAGETHPLAEALALLRGATDFAVRCYAEVQGSGGDPLALAVREGEPAGASRVWVNPVVLVVRTDGDGLAAPRPANVFGLLLDDRAVRFAWAPDQTLRGNAAWLARYWATEWGGTVAPAGTDRDVLPAPPVAAAGGAPVRAPRSAPGLEAQLLAWANEGRLGELRAVRFAARVLAAFRDENPGREFPLALDGFVEGTDPVAFREEAFAEAFAGGLVIPVSPVLVRLPAFRLAGRSDPTLAMAYEGALGGCWVDPVRSAFGRGRGFLRRLLGAWAEPSPAPERIELRLETGWWENWFDTLWTAPAETAVVFRPGGDGFRLGVAHLGTSRLGRGRARYEVSRRIGFY